MSEKRTNPSAQGVIDQWRLQFQDESYVCWRKKSPWERLNQLQAPPENVQDCKHISLDMGRNEYESTSFVLTNLSEGPLTFNVTHDPIGVSATLRKAVWVKVDDGSSVNDALSLIDDGRVVIPSGESLEIWVTLHGNNAAAGKYKQTINVSPKGLKSQTVDIAVTVHDLFLPEPLPLAVFFFEEFTGEWRRTKPNLVEAYMSDLKSHYVNHAFVHPDDLPRLAVDSKGKLAADYAHFDHVLDSYQILAPKTFIFFWAPEGYLEPSGILGGHPEAKGRPKFMTPQWRNLFREWLTGWVAHMKARGIGYDGFVMHPYDEKGGPKVQAMIQLIKEVDPKILVLYNGGIGKSAESIKKNIAPYADAWMPYLYHYLGTGGINGDATQQVPLKPNTDYTLSFYIKNAGSSLYLSLSFNGSTSRIADEADAADWREYNRTFTTSSDTTQVQIGLFPNVGNKALLIDDVVLRAESGPNLIVDGSMEAMDLSDNWSVNRATIVANTKDVHSGKQCAEIKSLPRQSGFARTVGKQLLGVENGKFFWTYANPVGIDPGRASPYSAYRLPVWLAWKEEMNGFATWAYKNGRWNGTKKGPNWGLVYRSDFADCPAGVSKQELVIPSKRWEATRDGLEDYAYLYLLTQAICDGSSEAGAKAKSLLASSMEEVLNDENNPLLADKAKRQIIEAICELTPTR